VTLIMTGVVSHVGEQHRGINEALLHPSHQKWSAQSRRGAPPVCWTVLNNFRQIYDIAGGNVSVEARHAMHSSAEEAGGEDLRV
jgi:hypothetical protein